MPQPGGAGCGYTSPHPDGRELPELSRRRVGCNSYFPQATRLPLQAFGTRVVIPGTFLDQLSTHRYVHQRKGELVVKTEVSIEYCVV